MNSLGNAYEDPSRQDSGTTNDLELYNSLPGNALITHQIIESSPSGMILVDAQKPDMPIVYVNSAFEKTSGYSREEVLGKNCRFLQGKDTNQPAREIMRTALARREECTVVLRNYRKDGTLFWNELRLSPLRNDQGVVTHYVGTQHDITERKQAEEILQAKHDHLERFFTIAIDLLCIANTKGQFIRLNKAWEQLLGVPLETLEGVDFLDFVHPDDHEATLEALKDLSHQKPVKNFVNRYRAKDGSYRFIEWRSFPYDDLIYAAARDITDRVALEEQLRRSEALMHSIINNQNTFVLRTDMNGNYTFSNKALYDRFDWLFPTPEDLIGATSLSTIIPDDHAKAYQVVADCVQNPGKAFQVVLRKPTAEGGFFWALWEFIGLTDSEGTVSEIQCVGIDITERKKIEQHEFELALEKERMRLLSAFIQNAAHEFRTPLAIISTSAYLMSRADDGTVRTTKAEQVDDQVQTITRLVDMLLLMVKLETLDPLVHTSVNVNNLITSVCEESVTKYGAAPVLFCRVAPDGLVIWGSEDLLRTALLQLLENAYRFTPPEGHITLSAYQSESQVCLDVEDTGAGIAEPMRAHIFEAFWRQDDMHSTPGFGLGLTIVRKIVELHSGNIALEPDRGEGLGFHMTFPNPATANVRVTAPQN